MNFIQIRSDFAQFLAQLQGKIELRDSTGKALGEFIPADKYRPPSDYEMPYSAEELKVIDAQTIGRPLHDILRDLSERK